VEAPRVISEARDQWGAMSAEIQAARDEVMATEKQVEAEALEASAVVFETGVAASQRAAIASLAAGVGYLFTSHVMHLLALAFQAPVALVVLQQKFGVVALAAFGAGSASMLRPASDAGGARPFALGTLAPMVASNLALMGAVGLMLIGPWARTVLAAADLEAFDADPIPGLVDKLSRLMEDRKQQNRQQQQQQQQQQQNRSRALQEIGLFGIEDVGNAMRTAGSVAEQMKQRTQEAMTKGAAVAQQAKGEAKVAADKGEAVASQAHQQTGRVVKKAADKARNATVEVVKAVAIPKPNTATTTVAPITTGRPPETSSWWQLVSPSAAAVGSAISRWAFPVVADVALASVAVLAAELFVSAGRHSPTFHCPCQRGGAVSAVGHALSDAAASWMWGAAVLVGVWLASILLAVELRPYAEQAQGFTGPLQGLLAFFLGCICLALCAQRAKMFAKLECSSCGGAGKHAQTGAAGSPESFAHLLSKDEEDGTSQSASRDQWSKLSTFQQQHGAAVPTRAVVATTPHSMKPPLYQDAASEDTTWDSDFEKEKIRTGCIWTLLAAVVGAIISAAEAPLASWSMGGAIKNWMTSHWLLAFMPWELVLEHACPGWPAWLRSSQWPAIAGAVILASVVGLLLAVAKRAAASSS